MSGPKPMLTASLRNRAEAGPSLAPPATSKARYLRDRFNVIKQVILRNEHFSPPTLVGQERQDYMKVRRDFRAISQTLTDPLPLVHSSPQSRTCSVGREVTSSSSACSLGWKMALCTWRIWTTRLNWTCQKLWVVGLVEEAQQLTVLLSQTPESGLFTEGSFVLIDGDYTVDSIFKVNEMGHPPSERRAAAR